MAIHNSYVADCSAWSMTKDEYFAKVTGYQISSIGFLSQLDKIKEWAWESVEGVLDGLVDTISYFNNFIIDDVYLKFNTKSYSANQAYNKLISDLSFNETARAGLDIVVAGLVAYASGGSNIEIILNSIIAGLPSPEPGPFSFIYQQTSSRSDAIEMAVATELLGAIENTELGYYVSDVFLRRDFISKIENAQDEIYLYKPKTLEGEVYNAYKQYYLETVKLMNINGVDSWNNKVDALKKSLEYKWNNLS